MLAIVHRAVARNLPSSSKGTGTPKSPRPKGTARSTAPATRAASSFPRDSCAPGKCNSTRRRKQDANQHIARSRLFQSSSGDMRRTRASSSNSRAIPRPGNHKRCCPGRRTSTTTTPSQLASQHDHGSMQYLQRTVVVGGQCSPSRHTATNNTPRTMMMMMMMMHRRSHPPRTIHYPPSTTHLLALALLPVATAVDGRASEPLRYASPTAPVVPFSLSLDGAFAGEVADEE